eukprot:Blabericola_migrator_1__1706@NODE_145_length_12990_cov_99_814439_g126_i0_p2_GENE_NODE_145_length_12990_cov_99_814439_g126_i0NODE_145_length_12990_cov_99_814439_g126_i0_p2_ORF_typecomplete_len735_score164_46Ku_PK_bind/PF08785_11/0_098Rsa3/PF14615_6/44Rsa3/PF14615_6/20Rsa3/PF14615_6/2_7e03INCENP_ARKbind/PF03941_15/1_8e04INCENP_ARKbind/PF03941_15/0_11_NODE_145_length_12990_cov_99_814439_g126_i023614565
MSDEPLSQTPDGNKGAQLIEDEEFASQVSGLVLKTLLSACAALSDLTDNIQKGMIAIKERAAEDYEEFVGKINGENQDIDWINFVELLTERHINAVQAPEATEAEVSAEESERSAVSTVSKVFEKEQLALVARRALELEDVWEERWMHSERTSFSRDENDDFNGQQSKKRPRQTFNSVPHDTPLSFTSPFGRGSRRSVKMTPRLASCAKRFAEELSTMRRVDPRRMTQSSNFVLISGDPAARHPSAARSFRLSSVLGASAMPSEKGVKSAMTEPHNREPLSVTKMDEPRYTFGHTNTDDWQEANEEMSCPSSKLESVNDEEKSPSVLSMEDSEGTEDEECMVRPSIDPTSVECVDDAEGEAVGMMDEDDEEGSCTSLKDGQQDRAQVTVPQSDPEDEDEMDDDDEEEDEEDEISRTSSCDSDISEELEVADISQNTEMDKSPPPKSPSHGYLTGGVSAFLKTPLARIQEKLGAFGRQANKGFNSEETFKPVPPALPRRSSSTGLMKEEDSNTEETIIKPAKQPALVSRGTPSSIKSETQGDVQQPAVTFSEDVDQVRMKPTKHSHHRFLKDLPPKNPAFSADLNGIDQGFERRAWVDCAVWARATTWHREVQRQAKWNPYSLFGYGVKAAQFTDVFQTPDFRRATSTFRVPDKTDGRKSRMNRWEVDKIACAFNESEGMTQEQLESMVKLLKKTEDISDMAYESQWIPCTSECHHDPRKKQPWHTQLPVEVRPY